MFVHTHELVIECCYLYCYAISLLIRGQDSKQVYKYTLEEAIRRSRITGNSTVKYWFENDIDESEMPIPHYRPHNYIKVSILWAFFYLKNNFTFEDAMADILLRGGDTQANAAIVGGLLGAALGENVINQEKVNSVLNYLDTNIKIESQGRVIKIRDQMDKLFKSCPNELNVVWDKKTLKGFT